MTGTTFAFLTLAAVLTVWATLSVLRSTAGRRWAEVKEAVAAHAESERARGETGPPSWTWDIGRGEPVPLPLEAEVVRHGESGFAVVVVPERAVPRRPLPLWAWVSGYPAGLFHGAFALVSVALGALALWLRAR